MAHCLPHDKHVNNPAQHRSLLFVVSPFLLEPVSSPIFLSLLLTKKISMKGCLLEKLPFLSLQFRCRLSTRLSLQPQSRRRLMRWACGHSLQKSSSWQRHIMAQGHRCIPRQHVTSTSSNKQLNLFTLCLRKPRGGERLGRKKKRKVSGRFEKGKLYDPHDIVISHQEQEKEKEREQKEKAEKAKEKEEAKRKQMEEKEQKKQERQARTEERRQEKEEEAKRKRKRQEDNTCKAKYGKTCRIGNDWVCCVHCVEFWVLQEACSERGGHKT